KRFSGLLNELAERALLWSHCIVPLRIGSKDGTLDPTPLADVTIPELPAPAPPVPVVVPPAPDPVLVLPIPPTPPPGEPCTTPVLTPRIAAPALERRTSTSAMLRL